MYILRQASSSRLSSGLDQFRGAFRVKARLQINFFDRNIIRSRWPKINRNPLQHAGNLIMRIARGSIRRRVKKRGKPSNAGRPPYSRQPGQTPPFKQIFSVPMNFGTSVIVGMVGYHHGTTGPAVPGLHEHGGQATRAVWASGSQRRLKSGRMGKKQTTYKRKQVKYPKRPFMMPALIKARTVLPSLWANSVRQ